MGHYHPLLAILVVAVGRLDLCSAECGGVSSSCPPPPSGDNVVYAPVNTCYVDTTSVSYTCGGSMSGPTSNICKNGAWSNPTPTCEVFTCTPPAVTSDITITPDQSSYDARTTVTFTCPAGETMFGPPTTICDAQDAWNPSTIPICKAMCTTPNVTNGVATPEGTKFSEGETAAVTCNSGYSLEAGSSGTITCGANGNWNSIPKCFPTCTVPNIANSDFAAGGTIDHGETVYIDCDTGYSYNQEMVFEVTCGYDGLRPSTLLPTKCFPDCPALATPTNGAVSATNQEGSTATFTCNRGYTLENTADGTATCTGGAWDSGYPNAPNCIALTGNDRVTLTCYSKNFTVEIPQDLLNDNTGASLHLVDTSCQGSGQKVAGYVVIGSDYDECGTTSQVDAVTNEVTYINKVEAETSDTGVTTERPLDLNVLCRFDQDNLVSMYFVIGNNITFGLQALSGGYYYTFNVYKQNTFEVSQEPPVSLYGDQVAYVKLQLESKVNGTLYGTHCHATPDASPTSTVSYQLLQDGCPIYDRVSLFDTSSTDLFPKPAIAFSMKKHQFEGRESIYLHCYAKLCEGGQQCDIPDCSARRKRRSSQGQFYQSLTIGPITWYPETTRTSDRSIDSDVALILYLGCAVLATLSFGIVLYVWCRYAKRKSQPKTVDMELEERVTEAPAEQSEQSTSE